jgi:galactokinase
MQHDYEISCPEIDFLVDRAISIEGVYGARMTGGGFGGCTVNMMQPDAVEGFREKISKTYEREYQVTPVLIEVNPSRGAGEDSPK